jgi:hypothetical protein
MDARMPESTGDSKRRARSTESPSCDNKAPDAGKRARGIEHGRAVAESATTSGCPDSLPELSLQVRWTSVTGRTKMTTLSLQQMGTCHDCTGGALPSFSHGAPQSLGSCLSCRRILPQACACPWCGAHLFSLACRAVVKHVLVCCLPKPPVHHHSVLVT